MATLERTQVARMVRLLTEIWADPNSADALLLIELEQTLLELGLLQPISPDDDLDNRDHRYRVSDYALALMRDGAAGGTF